MGAPNLCDTTNITRIHLRFRDHCRRGEERVRESEDCYVCCEIEYSIYDRETEPRSCLPNQDQNSNTTNRQANMDEGNLTKPHP